MNLQSESTSDPHALDAVQESKNRVASMALIHQKLYQGENLAAVEMKDYFKTIGQAVIESFGKKGENISLDVKMDTVELDVDTAIPIGLITNELITNSLKYAFNRQKDGKIKISLTKGKDDLFKMIIADNGKGIKEQEKENGLGTMLVQLLTTQLGGQIQRGTDDGTSIILSFRDRERLVA